MALGLPVEGPLVFWAGEVENTEKSFLANWLKEKCPEVLRKESCDEG